MKRINRPNRLEVEDFRKTHSVKETAEHFGLKHSMMETILKEFGIYGTDYLYRKEAPNYLTAHQQEIINGNLLGDGWILYQRRANTEFSIEQKLDNTDYVKFLYKVYAGFSKQYSEGKRNKPVRINGKLSKNEFDGKIHFCKIRTISHPVFNKLREKWYEYPDVAKSRKIIPNDLNLTWKTVAFWACDDGSNGPSRRDFKFYTDGFKFEEAEFLLDKFKINLGISGKIHIRSNMPVLYFYGSNAEEIKNNIKEYIPWSCFSHKLIPNKPIKLK